jgi:hypothetical protein
MANKKSFFHIALRRSTAIVIDLAVILIGLCHYASNACLRHALTLSGAAAEDWFELSRLFEFGEASGLVMAVTMLVRYAVDAYRARHDRAPTSAAWIVIALSEALLSVPALWLADYRLELRPKLELTIPVERFDKEFPGVRLPEEPLSVVLDETYLAGFLRVRDRIVFAVRGNRFVRIRPTKFHYVYGSIDVVPADTNLVYIHSCRSRYRSTLGMQGIDW